MICSQYCASSALQPSLVVLQLADALSANGSHQTWLHARVLSCIISSHLIYQTIFDVNVAFHLLISDIEVLDVQMVRVLASTLVFVGLEQHGTFIVLVEDILLDWISMCLKK